VPLTPGARVALTLLILLALLTAGLILRSARDSQPAPTVTARPPIEAVPIQTPAQLSAERSRQCEAHADARKLEGPSHQSFVQECVAR
jgi:hypothetical protein